MGNRSKSALLIVLLFLFSSLATVITSVSANPIVDNYPEGEAWITIELKSWEADQTEQWDSDDGNPDPHFEVCIEADGNNVQCEDSQTWSNQLTLGNVWNFSVDIPDETSIVNLTIECRDNDALNDDECDMNPVTGEWKLYYEFNWTSFSSLDFSGDGSLDNDSGRKDAASNWTVSSWGIIDDDDSDNVANIHDSCPNGFGNWTYDNITDYDSDGCLDDDWYGFKDFVITDPNLDQDSRVDHIASDDEGRVYVAGVFQDNMTLGNYSLTTSGNVGLFVARLGLSGNWDWAVSIDNTTTEVTGFDIDAAGNAYFSGLHNSRPSSSEWGFGAFEWNNIIYDPGDTTSFSFVAKVNSDGTEGYLQRFTTSNIDALAVNDNGQVLIAGAMAGSRIEHIGFQQYCINSNFKIFILRLGTDGVCISHSSASNAGGDVAPYASQTVSDIIFDENDDGFYLTGRFSGEFKVGTGTSGVTRHEDDSRCAGGNTCFDNIFYLTKGNTGNNFEWLSVDQSATIRSSSVGVKIGIASSGNPILVGHVDNAHAFKDQPTSGNSTGISTTTYGGQDVFLAEFSSNTGDFNWAISVGSNGSDEVDDIFIDKNELIHITAKTPAPGNGYNKTAFFGNITVSNNYTPALLASYNSFNNTWISVQEIGNVVENNISAPSRYIGYAYLTSGPANNSLAIAGSQSKIQNFGLYEPHLDSINDTSHYHGFLALYHPFEDNDDDNDSIVDSLDSCARGDLNWTSNLTTDWDADGCQDSGEDTDDDADNVTDFSDLCPQTILLAIVDSDGCSYAQRDNDGDGLQNSLDDCENGTQGWTADGLSDYDSDGCADADEDLDDDNDGVLDEQDLCELGTLDWQSDSSTDYDSDGCQDSGEDDDDDNDSVLDGADDCEMGDLNWASTSFTDHDSDGCQDAVEDTDDDNDNLTDSQDNCNTGDLNWNSSGITDYDSDGCQDSNEDNDDDNDLVLDNSDNCTNGDLNWVSNLVTDHDSDGCQDSEEDNDDDDDLVLDSFDGCTPGDIAWDSSSVTDYDSDGCQDNSEDTDDDNDGVIDSNDFCQFGDLGWIAGIATDSDGDGCQDDGEDTDDDNDLVDDALDECQNTPIDETSNAQGCSSSQRDSDQDGVNDAEDQCPQSSEIVDSQGCDLDTDSDGVIDMWDDCANTPNGYPVDVFGCPLDTDSDSDGVYDGIDECENTPLEATTDSKGCPMDSDSDGVYDGIDECPSSNNPAPSDMDKSSEVDSTGCFIDAAEGESDSSSSAFGFLAIVVMIGLLALVVRKIRSSNEKQTSYTQTELPSAPILPILPIQQVQMPDVVRELEKQRSKAQIESQQLRQQLSSQSISASQMAAMQQELENLQQRVSDSEYVKSQLVQEIDDMKKKGDSELSMQDSVIAGDALVGSTKIESQTINNDPQAIARAAIEAYRMAKEEQLD